MMSVAVNLLEADAPARLVAAAVEQHGGIDVVVNNVGATRPRLQGFLSITDEDLPSSLEINFFVALRATRAAVALMVERGGGAIVNIA